MRLFAISICAIIALAAFPAAAEVIVLGGANGLLWGSGGGEIKAQVIRNARSVETTNVPGGVIDFAPEGLENGIFPKRTDTELNIAISADSQTRGGLITSPNIQSIRSDLPKIIDDDGSTGLDMRLSAGANSAQVLGLLIDLDLGARFGVDRFRFFPRNAAPEFPTPLFPYQNDFMRSFEIFINDGTLETKFQGVPIRTSVAVVGQNEDPVVDIRIPPQYVRLVRLKSLTTTGFDIAEFQVYGTGFVPEAVYISNIFDFEDLALLGKLRWVQERVGDAERSRVAVRTRTGTDPGPVQFNKVRPGERIYRVGGTSSPPASAEVPWKFATDVEDEQLKALVEDVLDNESVELREAIQTFNTLTFEQQRMLALTEEEYKKLHGADKGDIRNDVTNWSEWSPPYPPSAIVAAAALGEDSGGVPIVSPSPRRYFQFMIELFSDDFESAIGIGGISFDVLSPPFAAELVGEIAPRTAALGEETHFTYAVRSMFRPGEDRGFNRLRIDTPLRVEKVGLVQLRRLDGSSAESDFTGVSLEELPVRGAGGFAIVEVEERSFTVEFPTIAEDGAQLRVNFDNAVLRFGTTFTGHALNIQEVGQLGQSLVAGNAADLGVEDPDLVAVGTPFEGNLSVAVPISGELLVNVLAAPQVFTPNEDGINDQGVIHYDLTNVGRPVEVDVAIYDLAGRPVRRLYTDADISGRFARPWDGKNDAGEIVPPGHYVFSVTLDAETGQTRGVGAIGVAY